MATVIRERDLATVNDPPSEPSERILPSTPLLRRALNAVELVDRDIPGPRRDFVGYGRRLPRVVWPYDAKVAVNIIVNHEEGSEYSIPAGDERNEGSRRSHTRCRLRSVT